jgi:hypothetical protein
MMVSVSKIVFFVSILLTILVSLQFTYGKAKQIFPPIIPPHLHLYITNNISNTALGVHCKDKHHDAGFRTINFGGVYEFEFTPTPIFRVTLWFCRFSWDNVFQYFDIYVQKRDVDYCDKECHWAINKSGPCRVRPTYSECYPWNPKVVM